MTRWTVRHNGAATGPSPLDLYAAMRSAEHDPLATGAGGASGLNGPDELILRNDEDDKTQSEGEADAQREGSDEEAGEGVESDQKGDDQLSRIG